MRWPATSPERAARRWTCAALALWALPWFGSALWGSSLLYFRDLIQNLYPWRRFWAQEAGAGRWPLWDPYSASGVPFLANPNNLSLYPPMWLQAALPFDLAFNAALALTWLMAQCGAYRLTRRLGAGRAAALLAALAWGGCGYVVSALNLANVLVAAAAAPWMAWAALGVRRRAATRDAAALGASTALCGLGGEPIALGVALAAAALLAGCGPRGRAAAPSSRWACLAAGMGLAALLAAPLALPALELVRLSERGAGLEASERARWPLTALGAAGLLLPRAGGDPTSFDPARSWSQALQPGGMPLLLSFYIGAPILCLAAVGWGGLPVPGRALSAAGVALALALAAGPALPLFPILEKAGAGSWVRYPAKFLIGAFAPLCVLAGLGLERLRRGSGPGRAGRLAPPTAGAALALALAADLAGGGWIGAAIAGSAGLGPAVARAAAAGVRAGLASAILVCLAAGALLGPLRRRLRPHALATAWILLVAGDLWVAQAGLVPRAPVEMLRLRPLFAGRMAGGARLYREERPRGFRLATPDASRLSGFLWDRRTLARGAAAEARIVNVLERPTDRLWPATTARLRRWMLEAEGAERVRLMRRLGVQWWQTYSGGEIPGTQRVEEASGLSDPPLQLRSVRDPLPPVFWSGDFAVAPGEEALRRGLLSEEGPDVWVEAGEGVALPAPERGLRQGKAGAGACTVIDRTTDALDLRCEAERPGLAVVLDAWYPGWEARVNGAPQEAVRVNGAYRGVVVPPGRHAVVWRFRPRSVRAGRVLGALGVVLLAVAASMRPPPWTKNVNRG